MWDQNVPELVVREIDGRLACVIVSVKSVEVCNGKARRTVISELLSATEHTPPYYARHINNSKAADRDHFRNPERP